MAVANSMKLSRGTDTGWPSINAEQAVANMTFDCVLHFETQLPTGGFFILIDRFVNDVAAVVVVIAEGRDESDVSFA
jgi:hypothetical protein